MNQYQDSFKSPWKVKNFSENDILAVVLAPLVNLNSSKVIYFKCQRPILLSIKVGSVRNFENSWSQK